MARKSVTQYFDDLNGASLTDEQLNVVSFSLDGKSYLIDLNAENAETFRELLQPYIDAGRRDVNRRGNGHRRSGAAGNTKSREIREWAIENGHAVAGRGKLPSEVIAEYNKHH